VVAAKVHDADLLISAIGDDLKEELLSEAVVRSDEQPPMVLVRTLHAGPAFRVALVRPDVDACVSCLAEYRAEKHPDWIDVPADGLPDVFDAGCATPSRPGAGLSCQHAAVFAAAPQRDGLSDQQRLAQVEPRREQLPQSGTVGPPSDPGRARLP
jgi:hypothetical protein